MIKYVAIKSELETDKYFDPLRPWLIVVEEDGRVFPDRIFDRFPSHRAANREIRRLVAGCRYALVGGGKEP